MASSSSSCSSLSSATDTSTLPVSSSSTISTLPLPLTSTATPLFSSSSATSLFSLSSTASPLFSSSSAANPNFANPLFSSSSTATSTAISPISYVFSEITHPSSTITTMSTPTTPFIGETNPIFSVLHQQLIFPTSTALVWTQPQPVITRALFLPITRSMGIDQIASALHGLNLSGSFHHNLINGCGLLPSLPPSGSFFPSALTAPNVTNLVIVKLQRLKTI